MSNMIHTLPRTFRATMTCPDCHGAGHLSRKPFPLWCRECEGVGVIFVNPGGPINGQRFAAAEPRTIDGQRVGHEVPSGWKSAQHRKTPAGIRKEAEG
jgi:DnaJ-class molecular chaperone